MANDPLEVARNEWGIILHHEQRQTLELRWLPSTRDMGDKGFKQSLELFAAKAEDARPDYLFIDATEFHHQPSLAVEEWREQEIIPRYNAAGVKKFALLAPPGFPETVEAGSVPAHKAASNFPTGWFAGRQRAYQWLVED